MSKDLPATVPDLPGCVSVAKKLDEARTLIAEAIEFPIEGMRLHGEHMPAPTTLAELARSVSPADEQGRVNS